MKLVVTGMILISTCIANAEKEQVCTISEIQKGIPVNWQQRAINGSEAFELQTEGGLFVARIIPMPEGLSMNLKSADSTAGGYFEKSATTPVLSLHVKNAHGQVNCWL